MLKSIYRLLPYKLQKTLRLCLHYIRNTSAQYTYSGISWQEFNKKVLSASGTYKGIFIQEPVIDWDMELYQRPQHLSYALARLGYLVIYKIDIIHIKKVKGFFNIEPNVWLTQSKDVEKITGAVHSFYSTVFVGSAMKELFKKKQKFVYEYIDHIDPQIRSSFSKKWR